MSAVESGPQNDGVPINQLEVMSVNQQKKRKRRVRDQEEVLSEEEKQAEVREAPVAGSVMLPVFNGREDEAMDDEEIARRLQEAEN